MRRGRSSWWRARVVLVGALAVGLGGLAFACGSEEDGGPAACEGAACSEGGVESSTTDGPPREDSDRPQADGGPDAVADSSVVVSCDDAGQLGSLDRTFGDEGMVWLKYPGSAANAVAVQSDGKLVIGGQTGGSSGKFALVRLLPNGNLDPSFGTNGLVERVVGDVNSVINAIALQPDGRVVAAGYTRPTAGSFTFATVRHMQDGGADPSFGDAGLVLTSFPGRQAYARSIAVQPDGKILVAGISEGAVEGTADFAMVRYSADGLLDATFGTGGRLTLDVRGTRDEPGIVALAGGGKIVVAGGSSETLDDPIRTDLAAARLDTTGSLDPTFGTGGKFTTAFGGSQRAFAVAVDLSGRLVLGGHNGSGFDFGVFRLTSAGALDPSFGDGGATSHDFGASSDGVGAILIQQDGKLLAVGSSIVGSGTGSIASARFLPNGGLDATFGMGGKTLTPPPANADLSAVGAALTDCAFVTVGTWSYENNTVPQTAMGIARYRR